MADEWLVRKSRQHKPQAVQIAIVLDVLPTEDIGLYNRRQCRPPWLGVDSFNPFDPG
jgi:hypothetical protein